MAKRPLRPQHLEITQTHHDGIAPYPRGQQVVAEGAERQPQSMPHGQGKQHRTKNVHQRDFAVTIFSIQ